MFLQENDLSTPIDFNEPIQFHVDAESFMDINIDQIHPKKSSHKKNDTCNLVIFHRPNSSVSALDSLKSTNLLSMKSQIKKQKSSPTPIIPQLLTVGDSEFMTLCGDQDVRFNPKSLGFIPYSYWNDEELTFGDLVRNYFQKRNDPNCHFYQKLYNALLITTDDPFYAEFLGVEWITDCVLMVDESVISRLFGFKRPDTSLFHRHGFFSTYGFTELCSSDATALISKTNLAEINFDHVRLLIHKDHIFTKFCNVDALDEYACRCSQ